MGRDADAKWVQWLTERNNPTVSSRNPSSSTSPLPTAGSLAPHDSGPLHIRNNATSYFILLCTAQDQQHRRQGRLPTMSPSRDSSWASWLSDRGATQPISDGVNPEMTTTGAEPRSTSTTPASAASNLRYPLTAALTEPESHPEVADVDALKDMDPMALDAELLAWFPGETPMASVKRTSDGFPGGLSVSKKQKVCYCNGG